MIINTIYIIICEYTLNTTFKKEHINNDLPNNQITQEGDSNLLIPTSEQVYNPNDSNRPDNAYSHQVTQLNNLNDNTILANTDPSIPIVYTHDELENTKYAITPSSYTDMLDSGSGQIPVTDNINNNVMNDFSGIN